MNKDIAPANTNLDKQEQNPAVIRQMMLSQSMHFGPLPPPEMLSKYDDACPGAAERIIRMAEKEQDHRIGSESQELSIIENASRDKSDITKSGQNRSFIIALAMLALMAYLGSLGQEKAVMMLSFALLGGVVTTLITGKNESDSSITAAIKGIFQSKEKPLEQEKKQEKKKAGK